MKKVQIIYGENATGKTTYYNSLGDECEKISIATMEHSKHVYIGNMHNIALEIKSFIEELLVTMTIDYSDAEKYRKDARRSKDFEFIFNDEISFFNRLIEYNPRKLKVSPISTLITPEKYNSIWDDLEEVENPDTIIRAAIQDNIYKTMSSKFGHLIKRYNIDLVVKPSDINESNKDNSIYKALSDKYTMLQLSSITIEMLDKRRVSFEQDGGIEKVFMDSLYYVINKYSLSKFDSLKKKFQQAKNAQEDNDILQNTLQQIEWDLSKKVYIDNKIPRYIVKTDSISRGQASFISLISKMLSSDKDIIAIDDLFEALDTVNTPLILNSVIKMSDILKKEIILLTHFDLSNYVTEENEYLVEYLYIPLMSVAPAATSVKTKVVKKGKPLSVKAYYQHVSQWKGNKSNEGWHLVNITGKLFCRETGVADRLHNSKKKPILQKEHSIGYHLYSTISSEFMKYHNRDLDYKIFDQSRNFAKSFSTNRILRFTECMIKALKTETKDALFGISVLDMLSYYEALYTRLLNQKHKKTTPKYISEKIHKLDLIRISDKTKI